MTIGASISDTATLSGATATATGSFTFKLYGPFTGNDATTDTCVDSGTGANLVTTITPIGIGTVNGSGNFVASSGPYTPTAVGRYQWIASYGGDGSNEAIAGTCKAANEASVVAKQQPAISTSATASVLLSQSISDTATLSGATATATGSFTFKLYGPFTGNDATTDTCVDSGTGANLVTTITPIGIGTVNGSGNFVASSGPYTPTAVGRYQWIASYGGDGSNEAIAGTCKAANEASVVGKAPSTIATAQKLTPQDSVTVSATAGGTPGGNVTFKLYGSDNPTCAAGGAAAKYTETVTLAADGTASTHNTSFDVSAATASTYKWVVAYVGDTTHDPVTSSCGTEQFTLTIANS